MAIGRWLRRMAAGIAVVLATVFAVPSATAYAASISDSAYDMYRGPNTSSSVILSFDDCPKNLTQLRDVLNYVSRPEVNIGLVLAPTGVCIDNYKKSSGVDIALLARQHGQYTINHTYDHPNLTTLTRDQVVREIHSNVVTDYGRPPYGAINDMVRATYKAEQIRMWLWRVDSEDWKGKSTDEVVNYVVQNSRAGQTTLMHMQWNGFNPGAIARMKAGLAARELSVCRAHRGYDNAGAIIQAPRWLLDQPLPC